MPTHSMPLRPDRKFHLVKESRSDTTTGTATKMTKMIIAGVINSQPARFSSCARLEIFLIDIPFL